VVALALTWAGAIAAGPLVFGTGRGACEAIAFYGALGLGELAYVVYRQSQIELEARGLQGSLARLRERTAALAQLSARLGGQLEQIASKAREEALAACAFQKTLEASLESTFMGKQTIDELVSAMNDIGAGNASLVVDLEATSREFAEVFQVIHAIAEKTKFINELVFQTKLLSFNAAVEAARAGEQGRGFSVVANEIGNLARLSGASAKNISEILKAGSSTVQEIVARSEQRGKELIEKSSEGIAAGTQIAKRCEHYYDVLIESGMKANEAAVQLATTAQGEESVSQVARAAAGGAGNGEPANSVSEMVELLAAETKAVSTEIEHRVDRLDDLLRGWSVAKVADFLAKRPAGSAASGGLGAAAGAASSAGTSPAGDASAGGRGVEDGWGDPGSLDGESGDSRKIA
jgi:methyl-accepting chemotaxis protein